MHGSGRPRAAPFLSVSNTAAPQCRLPTPQNKVPFGLDLDVATFSETFVKEK